MVGIRLRFVQNTYIFHHRIQIQLRDKRQRCQSDPVVVITVHADLLMKLGILISYSLRSLFTYEDLQWTQKIIFGNRPYNNINYTLIPWEKFDDLVGKQANNFFPLQFIAWIILGSDTFHK